MHHWRNRSLHFFFLFYGNVVFSANTLDPLFWYFRQYVEIRSVLWHRKGGDWCNTNVVLAMQMFLALLYNIKWKHSKIKKSIDTLVTREILTNFTSLLNGQMSCNGLSIKVVTPLWSSMRVKQLISYECNESFWVVCSANCWTV